MPKDKPDDNPSVVDAAIGGYQGVAASVASGGEDVATAAQNAVGVVDHDATSAVAAAHHSYVAAGRDLSVTFSDVEAMTAAIQDLNRFVMPLIGSVGAVATDPDLLASLVLSPITGANAEAAAATAAARLGVNLAVTEGLALVTASVVSSYQLADSALSAAAATLRADARIAGSVVGGFSAVGGSAFSAEVRTAGSALGGLKGVTAAVGDLDVSIITLPTLVGGIIIAGAGALNSGAFMEAGDVFTASIRQTLAGESPWDITFGTQVGARFLQNFSWNNVFADTAGIFQGALGATGSSYDAILGMLIHDGHTLGMFREGRAEVEKLQLSPYLDKSNRDAARAADSAIYGRTDSLAIDERNRVLPHDLASLFAGASQIDNVGRSNFSDIRIIQTGEGPAASYIVQIPSTQSWLPWTGAVPNDLTSDLYAMRYGDQTALANAVFQAMHDAGIRTGEGGQPVMLTGFSLGGITAGAMAADPRGYHIEQLVTAGSPIGAMNIPATTHVTAFEARQDLVPTLDGTPNPTSWTTIRHDASAFSTENPSSTFTPLEAHDANRYAVMAKENTDVSTDPAIAKFFGGSQSVTDFYAHRE
jgi:hypothetical protein